MRQFAIYLLLVPLTAAALNISAYNITTGCSYPPPDRIYQYVALIDDPNRPNDLLCELTDQKGRLNKPPTFCCPPEYECRENGLCVYPNNVTVYSGGGFPIEPNDTWWRDDTVVWAMAPSCSDPKWGCTCNGKLCFNEHTQNYSHAYRQGFWPQKPCDDLRFLNDTIGWDYWFSAWLSTNSSQYGSQGCEFAQKEKEFWGPLGTVVRPALTTPTKRVYVEGPPVGSNTPNMIPMLLVVILPPIFGGLALIGCCICCCCCYSRKKRTEAVRLDRERRERREREAAATAAASSVADEEARRQERGQGDVELQEMPPPPYSEVERKDV